MVAAAAEISAKVAQQHCQVVGSSVAGDRARNGGQKGRQPVAVHNTQQLLLDFHVALKRFFVLQNRDGLFCNGTKQHLESNYIERERKIDSQIKTEQDNIIQEDTQGGSIISGIWYRAVLYRCGIYIVLISQ